MSGGWYIHARFRLIIGRDREDSTLRLFRIVGLVGVGVALRPVNSFLLVLIRKLIQSALRARASTRWTLRIDQLIGPET